MKRLAIVLALASGTPACAHKQLTNQEFAAGAVYLVAVFALIFLAVQCNGMQCHE
jgi:hypothetical protein